MREQLNNAYDDFFGDGYNGPKILTIDTNNLNYVANVEDLKQVENRIRQSLEMTPFQTELPLKLEEVD